MIYHPVSDLGIHTKSSYAIEHFDCPRCGMAKGEPCAIGNEQSEEMKIRGVTHVVRVALAEESWALTH